MTATVPATTADTGAPTPPEVIVVGAGPVGLLLAYALGRRGTHVVVLEALTELSDEARASTLHPPTLELLDDWGLLDAIIDKGPVVDRLQYWDRATNELLAEFDYAAIADDTRFPFRLQCPQNIVAAHTLAALAAMPHVDVRFGHRVVDVSDNAVTATVRCETPNGAMVTFAAPYVVACDGSHSAVRRILDVGFDGKIYPDRFLLVTSNADLQAVLPNVGKVAYVFDADEWVILLQSGGQTRTVFRLRDDEDLDAAATETAVRKRIANFCGHDLAFDIHGIRTYAVHQRVAESFRYGRILLAGDAAHLNNPAGGMGLNSGIGDAAALAEALVATLADGDDRPLDDYARTRRAYATDLVHSSTDQSYADLSAADETARAERNARYRAVAADPAATREWLLHASMLAERI